MDEVLEEFYSNKSSTHKTLDFMQSILQNTTKYYKILQQNYYTTSDTIPYGGTVFNSIA